MVIVRAISNNFNKKGLKQFKFNTETQSITTNKGIYYVCKQQQKNLLNILLLAAQRLYP